MAGIDRVTGKPLDGFAHVVQSLRVIMATRIGSRVMRRSFGSAVPNLLGESLAPSTVLRFVTAIMVAVELWEPRFRIKRIDFPRAPNSAETMRLGKLSIVLVGEYRPRGHLGDPTPEGGERTVPL